MPTGARMLAIGTALAIAIGLGTTGEALAKERSRARAELEATGLDPDASGDLRWNLKEGRSILVVRARNLDAGSYTVRVDGVPEANLEVEPGRNARVRFRSDARPGRQEPFDFDPRGREIEFEGGAGTVLSVAIATTTPEPTGTVLEERTSLAPTAAAPPGGEAEARFRQRRDGRRSFQVELEDVPAGSYALFVDGVQRGEIAVTLGRGKIEFDSDDARKPLLDFDPRGVTIDVVQAGSVLFSGPLVARAPGVSVCTPSESLVFLAPSAAGAGGQARLRLRTGDDCERDFEVEVEDVAVGPYELLVDGVVVGTIQVALDPVSGEREGEIEFDTDADDPDELPLTFDPTGAAIEIRQGGVVFFSGLADPQGTPPGTCAVEETSAALLPTLAQPAASGDARLRVRDDCDRDFRVQIEDVAPGSYDLVVGGVVRGTITAAFDPANGDVRGELEFDTDPDDPGELPLGFDPAGQTVEIVQGGVLVLSTVLTPGGGPGGPLSCVESQIERPLLNVGADPDAKGKARLRVRDDCRESFRVQIENLADGSYELVVGGVVEGTIAVALGQGEIEFDSADPPKPLLDFDPRGQQLEIRQGGSPFLSRLFD